MRRPEPPPSSHSPSTKSGNSFCLGLFVFLVAPVAVAVSVLIYQLDEFDAGPVPEEAWSWKDTIVVPNHYNNVASLMEKLGEGLLPGPEDLLYNHEDGLIYTGCGDGWIKRVKLSESASDVSVENWVHVGGRPLGLAFGPDKELIVAEPLKGLLKVTRDGLVTLLTNEAEGLKFGLINGVDVAENGVIYFTDSSHKYNITNFLLNILEGRPYGRLISFDPSTNQTQVLVRNINFANGVSISPLQDFVVFCETILRRCKRYYIDGKEKGTISEFVEQLPGYPDNLRYDGQGKIWITLTSGGTFFWKLLYKYPFLRKIKSIMIRYVNLPLMGSYGGVIAVNLDGEPIAFYSDPSLSVISSSIKFEDHIYIGSLRAPYIRRLSLKHFK